MDQVVRRKEIRTMNFKVLRGIGVILKKQCNKNMMKG